MSKVLDEQKQGGKTPALSTLGLPVKPEPLARALEKKLATETKRIDDALMAALQDELLQILSQWFGRKPDEVDQGLMKRLTNALLSAGKSGEDRTLSSLQSISNSTWERHVNRLAAEKAAEILREKTADLRRASAFLDHQAKCIKTFLKIITEPQGRFPEAELELKKGNLDTAQALTAWSTKVAYFWGESTNIDVKNRSMYKSYWSQFISVVINQDDQDYADHLSIRIQKYLLEGNQDLFKKSYRRIKDSARRADDINVAPKTALKLDSGQASLSTTFPISSDMVQQIKEDLLFMFASDDLLQKQQLEILVDENDLQTVMVKFAPPKEMLTSRRVIQALNSHIESAYSQITKQ